MEIDAEQLAAMLKTVVADTVSSTIAALKGPNGDPWDNVDQATIDQREADMERAKAERLAAIEAENAVIAERLRWQNMDPEELRQLEEEAAHRRYAEAIANTLLLGKDPLKEDFSALVEGLDPKRTQEMIDNVAAEIGGVKLEQIAAPIPDSFGMMMPVPEMVDPAKVTVKMARLKAEDVIATDIAFLEQKNASKNED